MNDVPQFPGKGGIAVPGKPGPTQPAAPWQKAMCPFLTAGEIARHQDSALVTPGVQKPAPAAQSCKGPVCMLFVQIKGADGQETTGCAPVHQLGATLALNGMVSRFMAAAEAGARAEAAAANASGIAELAAAPAPAPGLSVVPEPSPLTEAADAATETEPPKPT